jgi:CheY-like chemotaxis protein
MKNYLTSEGFICECASSCFEAEGYLSRFNYGIIILDLTLPGGDGLALIKLIKNRNIQACLLIFSVKNSPDDKIRGLDMGADDYITKPFHLEELNSPLKSLVRRRHFEASNELIFKEIKINSDSNHQADLVNSAYVYTLRISKLTHTLLLPTRIANDQFPEKSPVSFSALVDEKVALFEDYILRKSLIAKKEIEPECTHETIIFPAESLIINLFGNAVKHSSAEETVNIILNKNIFEISNPGDPLSLPASKLLTDL